MSSVASPPILRHFHTHGSGPPRCEVAREAARCIGDPLRDGRAPAHPRPRRRAGRRLPAVRPPHRNAGQPGRERVERRRRCGRGGRRGTRGRRCVRPSARGRGAASGTGRVGRRRAGRAARRARVRGGVEPRRRPLRARAARRRDVRRLPARALRPHRPPVPLPVRQLHELRAAADDRHTRPVRPAEHDDGRVPALRGLPARVRGPLRPALPRRADRVPRLRAAPLAAARAGCSRAARRRDRRGEGARRLPPRLRRDERGRRRSPARAQRQGGEAAGRDVRRPGRARRADAEGARAARLAGAPHRARAPPGWLPGRPLGRAGDAVARPDAPVHAAPPPALRRRRPSARHDERQPHGRADRLRRRGGAAAARSGRRPVPRARPADPPPLRGLRRPLGVPDAPLARLCPFRAAAARRRSSDRSSRPGRS